MRRRLLTRWSLGFTALLALALALCLMQTAAILRFRDPQPSVVAALGQRVGLADVALTLDRFDVGPRLPVKPDQDPPVVPPGAVLVAVVVTVEVTNPARDVGTVYCTLSLVDTDGRRWTTDYDVGYRLDMPDRTTCAGSEDEPVEPHRPYAVGAAFTVPAEAADRLRLRLELETEGVVVEFRR